VIALDPANLDATRMVAQAGLGSGNLQDAFAAYGALLKREPRDVEALNAVARYALGAGDAQRFNATVAKLKGASPNGVAVHEPDLLMAQGRLDVAAQRYYDVETATPVNPALSLKIGRLAVLRHSLEIAELELTKLGQSDPLYGRRVLQAYIAAEKRDRATADSELKAAFTSALPGGETWTYAAEVYAILADTPRVITALGKAAERKEPTSAYILANPLFRYLGNDPHFETVKAALFAEQGEIRTALAQVP
jgi:predicted Zn-dependent protease